jgi:DNA ligase (NAD+)
LSNKKFVFTGSLIKFSRNKASDIIKNNGGVVTSSITKNTDFLVVGENPGSKLDKAKKLNIRTLDEEEFLNLINEYME